MNQPPFPPDLILWGGTIRTLDESAPLAQAVAIGQGRILSTGSNREMLAMEGAATETVDLEGRLVIPGFFDSHFHFYQWSLGRTEMDFASVTSFAQAMDLIKDTAGKAQDGAWLTGYGFNESDWPENRIPDRHDLDLAGDGLPALIWRCDLHLAVASTKALELAGVDENTPDPVDGIIEKDQTGALTGVLREGAINLVRNHIPDPDDEALEQAMAGGIKGLHALGITALHDVRLSGVQKEAARTLRAWQSLNRKDMLELRCYAAIPGECLDLAVNLGLTTNFGDDRLRIGHVKYFLDGGMGARTGWTLSPYLDTGKNGICVYDPDKLYQQVQKAHDNGLAAMVHAIGDRASREITDIYEKLYKTTDMPGPAPSPPGGACPDDKDRGH